MFMRRLDQMAAMVGLAAARQTAQRSAAAIVAFHRWPMAWRLVFAVAIVVAAAGIRFSLQGRLGVHLAYVTFYPAVSIAALVSGLYGGILATLVAALLAHLLVAPLGDAGDFVGLVTFLVSGIVVSGIAEALLLARSRVAELEANRQNEAIVKTAVDGIVVIDEGGVVQSANPAIVVIFGYRAEELIGQNIKILMPDDFAHAHDGYLSEYKRTGIRKIIGIGREVMGKRRDGSLFPVDLAVAEWHDAAGRRFYTGIMRDITERKKVEEALAHTRRLHAVGRLAGGVAHDINNLLAVIAGNLEVAEYRTQDQETRQLFHRAMEAVEAGTSFNRRLLSLTQRRKLDPQRLIPNARVDQMVKLLQRTLGELVELDTKLAPDLWDVHCDSAEFDSALVNLAINSRDAMPDGGRLEIATRNVTLDASASKLYQDARRGDYVCVSVIDTGLGMTPEVLGHAMEPFFSTKEAGKGTGLGLSSVCGFVKQSGGFVTLDSEQGKGTAVSLYFPRAFDKPAAKTAGDPKEVPEGDGELILVVEDDDRVREITLKRLESLGYAVAEARSGPEAVKLLNSGEPVDLVFSDIVMPGKMTGYDLAKWVTTMKPDIKVVLTTGYNKNDSLGDVAAAGVKIPVLDKPYTRERLAQTMRSALIGQSA